MNDDKGTHLPSKIRNKQYGRASVAVEAGRGEVTSRIEVTLIRFENHTSLGSRVNRGIFETRADHSMPNSTVASTDWQFITRLQPLHNTAFIYHCRPPFPLKETNVIFIGLTTGDYLCYFEVRCCNSSRQYPLYRS